MESDRDQRIREYADNGGWERLEREFAAAHTPEPRAAKRRKWSSRVQPVERKHLKNRRK